MNPFKPIADILAAALPGAEAACFTFGAPPNPQLGDVCVPLFMAAKALGAPPPKLAARYSG